MKNEICGYIRKEGFGIRNYVLVISMVHCSNTVAIQIAQKTGTAAITHDKGCMESEVEHERTCLGLIQAGKNPNVHSALLVGLGCEQTNVKRIMEEISKAGKTVEYIGVQKEGGSPEAVVKGVEIVKKLMNEAAMQTREKISMEGLIIGVQCGGSDWTTALAGNTTIGALSDLVIENGGAVLMSELGGLPGSEHIIAQHAVNKEVGLQVLDLVEDLRFSYIRDNGHSIEEVNPTPGNKDGGITTLVEKSMGNIKKMGSSPVQGIIKIGEKLPHPGLWILDNRCEGPDSINVSGFAMTGAHAVIFSSGRGTPVGNAVMPIIKITGNPQRYEALKSIFDFNAGGVLNGVPIDKVGTELYELLLDAINGKKTKSEINGNTEFIIPRESSKSS